MSNRRLLGLGTPRSTGAGASGGRTARTATKSIPFMVATSATEPIGRGPKVPILRQVSVCGRGTGVSGKVGYVTSDAVHEPEGGWRQHMPFDAEERRGKARKIISLLQDERPLTGASMLEIGTGTGVIPAELAAVAGESGRVVSIDTMDTRITREGYEFQVTSGSALPFDDASFDVVVSNHVVEHVGDRTAQQVHLDEIRRVLRAGGVGYLATPTRWALVEPHFRVPLLSWLPRSQRDRYLRLSRRGKAYDVDPFSRRELRRAFEGAGLVWRERTIDALAELAQAEHPSVAVRVLMAAPSWMRSALRPAMPTMIFTVRPAT
jgi:SAM-dependent methyltransferase